MPGLTGALLRVRCRDQDDEGLVSVTATLVNTARAESGSMIDAFCIFSTLPYDSVTGEQIRVRPPRPRRAHGS